MTLFIIYIYQKIIKELDKEEQLSKSGIKTKDTVIIIDKKLEVNSEEKEIKLSGFDDSERNNAYIYSEKSHHLKRRNIKNKPKAKLKKKYLLIFILIPICLMIIIGWLLYYFIFYKKKKIYENSPLFEKDDLIVKINYLTDILYKYENNKILKMKGGQKNKEGNTTKEQMLFADIFFIIRRHILENNNMTNITKKWFSGYLGIFNMTLQNETNNIQLIYDKKLNKILNLDRNNFKNQNQRILKEDEIELCFVKIDFYENGEILNISYPLNNFSMSYMQYIRDYAKLIIPKISSNLYTDNINNKLNDLLSNETEYNEFYKLRELNNINNHNKKNNIIQKKIRKISSEESSEGFEIEEYLSPLKTQPLNLELREKENCTNCSEQNLYEISVNNFNNDEVDIDGGSLNKSIHRTINKDGILESIIEYENIILKNDDDNDISGNLNLGNQASNIIYNENEDAGTFFESDFNNYNFSFDIENLSFDSINKIILKDRTSNDKIIKNLYKYFDEFQYELFNETYYNDYMSSEIIKILREENNITEEYANITDKNENIKNKLRRNSESTYYGMKKIVNKKDLYDYNIIGMIMKNQIVNELDPSTGISYSYSEMIFGNINNVIKASKAYSNLHIILEKKNHMIFNLIKLVNQSNYDLKERNKNFTNIIIDLENNLLELLNDIDYSNLFRAHLDNIVDQLNYINNNIFDELIKLINNVYDNYSIILQDVINEKYNVFEIIRNITKKQYIEYIYSMINNLEIFHNSTMIFLDKIEEEVINLTNIEKMDFLYDILDSIYDCKLILNQFNKYLFKSIEKGIMIFEVDIYDFIEALIGDLLYITDYLSININKNELLIKSYNETERELLTFKLNRIKEIVNIIFELLLSNIKSDYNNEMSINNNESIKYISGIKSKEFLNETEERSYEIIKIIKSKISYMDLYEIYSENLDFINYIQNKSIIEFIENSYNHISKSILKLEPEYLNKSSDMMIKKENLFSISKMIINEINNEINGISLYIQKFIDKYKEQHLYNIYYNLYKINGMFLENEIKFLLDELKRLINETISMHKRKIDANYKLGFDYLNDLKYETVIDHDTDDTFIGKGFFDKYMKFQEYFIQFVSLIISDNSEIFINLENNYYKIKNDISNFLKNKFIINNYGFETNIYKDNFYFIKKMNDKLLSNFDKINQFFNEERFIFVKNEILKLFMSQIQNYNEQKLKEFTDLYEYIFSHTKGIIDTPQDYRYQFKRLGRVKKRTRWLEKTTNNINYIDISISQAIDYLNNNVPNIIKNFQTKVDEYLSNYIFYIQNIYTNINSYLQEKVKNNNNINILLNNYRNTFNILLNNDSNFGLLNKILHLDLNKNIQFCHDNLDNNLKLISENYYMNYYLKNYSSFLEFPEEIQYKINNFDNIIKIIINETKQNTNNLYRNRIINNIKSTNNYIINMLSSHKRYILIHLNKKDVINEYIQSKIDFITNNFDELSTQINKLSKDFMQDNNLKMNDLILSYDNFNLLISSIFKKINLFQKEFNSSISKDFKEENCIIKEYILCNCHE